VGQHDPRGDAALAANLYLALVCFGLTPAAAGAHKRSHVQASGHCCKAKKVKKTTRVTRCGKYCAIMNALAAKGVHRDKHGKWHGWVATRKGFAFYLDGRRHKGCKPWGPPMAYNNWEGGFHRGVF